MTPMCEYEEGLVAAFKSGTYHTYGKSDLVELPIDTSDRLKPAAIFRTSGTTTPLLVPMTHPELEMITNIGADCFKRSGMNVFVHEIVINCLNLSMWAGGTLDSMSIGKTGATVINFGTGNTSELIKLIDSLTLSHNNVTIHCTPSYLPVIRKKLELEDRIPKSLKLRQIYCGAEGGLDDDTFRSSLESEWGCGVVNANYGMSEMCSIMASASYDNRSQLVLSPLVLDAFDVVIKMDDDTMYTVNLRHLTNKDTVIEGELLLKPKDTLSLIKALKLPKYGYYATKEKVSINPATLELKVLGRLDDMLVVKGINFFPSQLQPIISRFDDFLSGIYQVRFHRDSQGVIDDLTLICELKSESQVTPTSISALKNDLAGHIRNELTLSFHDISFTTAFENLNNNKHKLVLETK